MAITTTIPTSLGFPHRGELERDDFVLAQETAQDLLAGSYTTALNQYATELNATEDDINLKWQQVQNQAVTGSYSQVYIDSNFVNKAINSLSAKTTPVDADLVYLGDSVSSFSLKKLTWANLKATMLSSFGAMIATLTSKSTPVDADIFAIGDSASSNITKKLTWANLKATMLIYFDTLYSRTTSIFGIGQSWQNLSGSRLKATTYTNTSGKAIALSITSKNSTTADGLSGEILVDGVSICSTIKVTANALESINLFCIVPDGSTYSYIQPSNDTYIWFELR